MCPVNMSQQTDVLVRRRHNATSIDSQRLEQDGRYHLCPDLVPCLIHVQSVVEKKFGAWPAILAKHRRGRIDINDVVAGFRQPFDVSVCLFPGRGDFDQRARLGLIGK